MWPECEEVQKGGNILLIHFAALYKWYNTTKQQYSNKDEKTNKQKTSYVFISSTRQGFYLLSPGLYWNVISLLRPSLTILYKIWTYDCLPIHILAPSTGFFALFITYH